MNLTLDSTAGRIWRKGLLLQLLPSWWTITTALICLLVSLPVLTVLLQMFGDNQGIWSHLSATVLPDYLSTTTLLMLGVGAGTFIIGVSTAWLVTMCRFPGRSIFEWALLLPLAMPAYIIAFVYTDLLEFAGPIQQELRDLFEWRSRRDYWFPEIRSLGGAISMMTLTLYPYVYLLTRAAFLEQNVGVLDASRSLGIGVWGSFFRVALPLARPSIVIGVALVLMESLNDFGTVDFFSVKTFTAGIYDVWLNMNSVTGAAQLSAVLLLFVAGLVIMERRARGTKGFQQSTATYHDLPQYPLKGLRRTAAFAACLLPVLLGFLIPSVVLGGYAFEHYETTLDADYFRFLSNSLLLSLLAAVIALTLGLFLASGARYSGSTFQKQASRIASIGYAVPGAVLAVGILVSLGTFDNFVDGWFRQHFGLSTGLLLSGTITAVTFGYVVRFLALSYGSSEASLSKVKPSMEEAAKTLRVGRLGMLRRLHFPIIRSSLLAATLLVFVDGMKELPMTIILRPFNFDTLATFVYQYASDELLEEASLAALTIIGTGVLPIIVMSFALAKSRPGHHKR